MGMEGFALGAGGRVGFGLGMGSRPWGVDKGREDGMGHVRKQ